MHHDVAAGVGSRLDKIRGCLHVEARDLTQRGDDLVAVAVRGVDAGADRGGTQVDLQERFGGAADGALLLR